MNIKRHNLIACFIVIHLAVTIYSFADSPEEHLARAGQACGFFDFETTITESEIALAEANDPSFDAVAASGLLAYALVKRNDEGDREKARLIIEKIAAENSDRFFVRFVHGAYLSANGDFDRSLNELTESLRMDSSQTLAYYERARLYCEMARCEEDPDSKAILISKMSEDFNTVIRMCPQEPYFRMQKAVAFVLVGEIAEASIELEDLCSTEDAPIAVRKVYAWCLRHQGSAWKTGNISSEEALAYYNQAINVMPDDSRGWAFRGLLHLAMNMPATALADANEAVRRSDDNNSALAYSVRGSVSLYLKQFHSAKADIEEVFNSGHYPPFALLQYAECCLYLGDATNALHYINMVLEKNPNDILALNIRATTHRLLGDRDAAEIDSNQASILIQEKAIDEDRLDTNTHMELPAFPYDNIEDNFPGVL